MFAALGHGGDLESFVTGRESYGKLWNFIGSTYQSQVSLSFAFVTLDSLEIAQ